MGEEWVCSCSGGGPSSRGYGGGLCDVPVGVSRL